MISQQILVGDLTIGIKAADNYGLLQAFAERFSNQAGSTGEPQLFLIGTEQGLVCEWCSTSGTKPIRLLADTHKFIAKQRSFPAPKQGAFNQALGRKTNRILDATGGWGSDAILMCSQGYKVCVLERNPVMALLLRDLMARLAQSVWAQEQGVEVPQVFERDAIDFLTTEPDSAVAIRQQLRGDHEIDCVYLDPMFPPKRKASAATNKYMQFLHFLLGPDNDSAQLLNAALATSISRIVVKRPHHADPLVRDPDQRFSSKLVHYDVYFNNQSSTR